MLLDIDKALSRLPPNSRLVTHESVAVPDEIGEKIFNNAVAEVCGSERELEETWQARCRPVSRRPRSPIKASDGKKRFRLAQFGVVRNRLRARKGLS